MPVTLQPTTLKYRSQGSDTWQEASVIKGTDGAVQDVQVGGTSVLNNGVANIPAASETTLGAVKVNSALGVGSYYNILMIAGAAPATIKAGTNGTAPITASSQDSATFYGLAKAAGSDEKDSSYPVGTYTDNAKSAIRTMLGAGTYSKPSGGIPSTDLTEAVQTSLGKADTALQSAPVTDVQVNGTSVLSSGVANVPKAHYNRFGVISPSSTGGLKIDDGILSIDRAGSSVKAGTNEYYPIVPYNQHSAAFYGLAKAAGDSTQSSSSNAVGTYTDNAKDAIQQMLGIDGLIAIHDTATATAAHAIGEIFIMNGKLYRATAAIAINDTITVGTNCEAVKIADVFPRDVQVNGTSAVSNGIANVPIGSWDTYGVYKVSSDVGIYKNSSGILYTVGASNDEIKAATHAYKVITPSNENAAAFYGLAKAAGDSTQTSSSNAIGTYTSGAKAAIQSMIGVENGVSFVETISGTTPTITAEPNTRYVCGEVSTLTITTPSVGTIDIVFDSGSTATVLTVTPPTGTTMKWPSWFDPTALVANTSYELLITDGVYGGVMTWAN